jgi:hypothetical protein
MKFQENLSRRSWLVPHEWTDRQTRDEANSVFFFYSFADAPKKDTNFRICLELTAE